MNVKRRQYNLKTVKKFLVDERKTEILKKKTGK